MMNTIVNNLTIMGKTLDQPLLVSTLSKKLPLILSTGTSSYIAYDTYQSPAEDRMKNFIKNSIVGFSTVASVLSVMKGITIGSVHLPGLFDFPGPEMIKFMNTKLIGGFIKKNSSKITEKQLSILHKAKDHILKYKEIKFLDKTIAPMAGGKEFLKKLIPDLQIASHSLIFKEMESLSILGLVPILGGISGGIFADYLTENNWRNNISNKIKEGSFQYLANIFLCNIGAGMALLLAESFKIKSGAGKLTAMVAGVFTTGIVGGTYIANYIGKGLINPLCEKGIHETFNDWSSGKLSHSKIMKNLNDERTPELVDALTHTDDLASVGVLCGIKWMEQLLIPILYVISGMRSAKGYRNKKDDSCKMSQERNRNQNLLQILPIKYPAKNCKKKNISPFRFFE